MITVRKSGDRGHADHGWLDSRHTFSFGGYRDPRHAGVGPLLVINEDRVAPGQGFPAHAHSDMEILSWVMEGALEHTDSTGTSAVIRPGELQRMSAGTGIRHSEYNQSKTEGVHFLQIWVRPARAGLPPGYEQKTFGDALDGRFVLLGSEDGRDGSITIHQDLNLWGARLRPGQAAELPVVAGRTQWMQVTSGAVRVGEEMLGAGDGATLTGMSALRLQADAATELLVFDMA